MKSFSQGWKGLVHVRGRWNLKREQIVGAGEEGINKAPAVGLVRQGGRPWLGPSSHGGLLLARDRLGNDPKPCDPVLANELGEKVCGGASGKSSLKKHRLKEMVPFIPLTNAGVSTTGRHSWFWSH